MHSIFKDKTSGDYYVVSSYSIEYPDYVKMTEMGSMLRIFDGTKRECNAYLEEIQEMV